MAGRGRGRLSTLPAWMSDPDVASSASFSGYNATANGNIGTSLQGVAVFPNRHENYSADHAVGQLHRDAVMPDYSGPTVRPTKDDSSDSSKISAQSR